MDFLLFISCTIGITHMFVRGGKLASDFKYELKVYDIILFIIGMPSEVILWSVLFILVYFFWLIDLIFEKVSESNTFLSKRIFK